MIQVGKYPALRVPNQQYSAFIKFKYDEILYRMVKSLPVRFYEPTNKVWEVPITDIDKIVRVFGKENIFIFNEFPEFEKYLAYLETAKNAKMSIDDLIKYYETIEPLVDYKFKTKPDGHQIECFNLCLDRDNILITDVMGLGKSKEAIDICDYRKTIGQSKHVLLLCGLNGLKYNWQRKEIPLHSYFNSQVIDGTLNQKIEKLMGYWKYYYNIVNIESIRNTEVRDKFGNLKEPNTNKFLDVLIKLCESRKFDIILIDEFHKASNHKSQQGIGLRNLQAPCKIGLSGTPITKKIERSWSILNWMGFESSSYWNFVKYYCILGGYSGWTPIGYKNLDELHEKFDRYQIRRPKEILKLPPKVPEVVYVEMTKSERAEYNRIKKAIKLEADGSIVQGNPANTVIPMRQFTDKVKMRALHDKVDELSDNNEPCVIYSMYKPALYDLQEELKDFNPLLVTGDETKISKRQDMVDLFQAGSTSDVIMGTPQVLGTGYTLTRSQYVLFLNKLWTCTDNEQAEDRCHRRGTTGSVTVLSFIVVDSIDERVEEILADDKKYIDKVVDGVPIFKMSNSDLLSFLMRDGAD